MLGGFLCRSYAGEHGAKTFWQGMEHMHGLPNLKRAVWRGMTSSRRRPQASGESTIPQASVCATLSAVEHLKVLEVLDRPQCAALNLGAGVGYNSAMDVAKAFSSQRPALFNPASASYDREILPLDMLTGR